MDTLKKRITSRLAEIGMTKADFARLIDVPRQTINNWEKRNAIPVTHIFKVADLLKCDPEWLSTGVIINNSSTPSTMPANMPRSDIPLVSWVMAGLTHQAEISEQVTEYTTSTRKHSPSTYALRVIGTSMTALSGQHSFPEGSIIIVDPEQCGDTSDGIFVIAKENGNDAVTFKQLKYDGATPYLNPLNPDHPKIFGEFRIIGKVIDAHLPPLP